MEMFPKPWTKLNGRTVVTSTYYRQLEGEEIGKDDDWPRTVYLVLLMNEQPPYFTVAHVSDDGFGSYNILNSEDRFNIVEAVEDLYTQWGGDI